MVKQPRGIARINYNILIIRYDETKKLYNGDGRSRYYCSRRIISSRWVNFVFIQRRDFVFQQQRCGAYGFVNLRNDNWPKKKKKKFYSLYKIIYSHLLYYLIITRAVSRKCSVYIYTRIKYFFLSLSLSKQCREYYFIIFKRNKKSIRAQRL